MKSGPVTFTSNIGDLGDMIAAKLRGFIENDVPALMEDQGARLSCFPGNGSEQGLFQAGAALAPSEQFLLDLPGRRAYRITHPGRLMFTDGVRPATGKSRPRPGRPRTTVGLEGEMQKRAKHRGYHAAGWLSDRLGRYAGGAAESFGQKGNRAVVALVLTGNQLSVSITNTAPAALEVAERAGYLEEVVGSHLEILLARVVQKQDELFKQLNSQQLPAPH